MQQQNTVLILSNSLQPLANKKVITLHLTFTGTYFDVISYALSQTRIVDILMKTSLATKCIRILFHRDVNNLNDLQHV